MILNSGPSKELSTLLTVLLDHVDAPLAIHKICTHPLHLARSHMELAANQPTKEIVFDGPLLTMTSKIRLGRRQVKRFTYKLEACPSP